MTVLRLAHPGGEAQAVVWRCEGCGCVHVRAGNTLLTFAPSEFAAFTESVNDCYWQGALTGAFADETLEQSLGSLPANLSLS